MVQCGSTSACRHGARVEMCRLPARRRADEAAQNSWEVGWAVKRAVRGQCHLLARPAASRCAVR